jgi:hypothetical protein
MTPVGHSAVFAGMLLATLGFVQIIGSPAYLALLATILLYVERTP